MKKLFITAATSLSLAALVITLNAGSVEESGQKKAENIDPKDEKINRLSQQIAKYKIQEAIVTPLQKVHDSSVNNPYSRMEMGPMTYFLTPKKSDNANEVVFALSMRKSSPPLPISQKKSEAKPAKAKELFDVKYDINSEKVYVWDKNKNKWQPPKGHPYVIFSGIFWQR